MLHDKLSKNWWTVAVSDLASRHTVTVTMDTLLPGFKSPALACPNVLLLLMALLIVPTNLYSAERQVTPWVSLTAEYDDNKGLTLVNEDSVFGQILGVGADIAVRSDRSEVNLSPSGEVIRYSGDDDGTRDTEDFYLPLTSYRNFERATLGLDVDLIRDSTTTSELEDSGEVDVNRRRNFARLNPYWTYNFSDATNFKLAYRYTDVSYDDTETDNLFDYSDNLISGTLTRRVSDKSEVFVTGNVANLDAPDRPADTDYGSIEVGINRSFSPDITGFVSVGGLDGDISEDAPGDDDNVSETLFNAGIERQSPLLRISARIGRFVTLSSRGRLNQTDRLRLKLRRRLSPTLTFVFSGTVLENADAADSSRGQRQYYDLTPGIRWQLKELWNLEGSYRFRRQDRDDDPEAAESNSVLVTATYHWRGSPVSR